MPRDQRRERVDITVSRAFDKFVVSNIRRVQRSALLWTSVVLLHRTRRHGSATLDESMSHPVDTVTSVPRLSEFYGIVIYMYFSDHEPPHFHALYAEFEAQIRIADGTVLTGELPRTAARLVTQWLEAHRNELMANWRRAQVPEPLVAIEPLR